MEHMVRLVLETSNGTSVYVRGKQRFDEIQLPSCVYNHETNCNTISLDVISTHSIDAIQSYVEIQHTSLRAHLVLFCSLSPLGDVSMSCVERNQVDRWGNKRHVHVCTSQRKKKFRRVLSYTTIVMNVTVRTDTCSSFGDDRASSFHCVLWCVCVFILYTIVQLPACTTCSTNCTRFVNKVCSCQIWFTLCDHVFFGKWVLLIAIHTNYAHIFTVYLYKHNNIP